MQSNLRRQFAGEFSAERLGDSRWRLAQNQPVPVEVYLHAAESRAAPVLGAQRLRDVAIEWCAGRVQLMVSTRGQIESLGAADIFVHEPSPSVLCALPLAKYDARARRFWARVFFLVRLPGGPAVLRRLARRPR